MQIIDIPVYNDDGTVQFTQQVSPEEARHLLSFALNFLAATGLSTVQAVGQAEAEKDKPAFND